MRPFMHFCFCCGALKKLRKICVDGDRCPVAHSTCLQFYLSVIRFLEYIENMQHGKSKLKKRLVLQTIENMIYFFSYKISQWSASVAWVSLVKFGLLPGGRPPLASGLPPPWPLPLTCSPRIHPLIITLLLLTSPVLVGNKWTHLLLFLSCSNLIVVSTINQSRVCSPDVCV